MAPTQLSEPIGAPLGPCISRHFNNKVPGCLDATIKVTVFRFWVIDNKYHLVVFEGTTLAPKRHILGNNGLVEVKQPLNLVTSFERFASIILNSFLKIGFLFRWVDQGFPHHVCVVSGWHKDRLVQFAKNHSVVVMS